MKKFFSILVAAMLCTTMWAETVRVDIDGYPYDLDNSTHIAYLRDSYLPFPANISVPYIVTYLGVDYTVNLTRVQFNLIPGALEVSITLAEGHTWLSLTDNWMNLTTLQLPSTFQTLAGEALSGCHGLTKIVCRAVTPPSMAASPSSAACAHAMLYVPLQSVDVYRSDPEWGKFANIQPWIFDGDTMLVDSLLYQIYPSKGKAVLISDQIFYSQTTIPYQVQVDSTIYKVDISQTDFGKNHRNRTIVRELRFEEGFDTIPGTLYNLESLNILQLPSTLREIGNLDLNRLLVQVDCHAVTPPSVKSTLLTLDWTRTFPFYVPYQSVEAYRADSIWGKVFGNILPLDIQEGDTILYRHVKYIAHPATKTVTLPSEQCFRSSSIVIPKRIYFANAYYTVDMSATDFLQSPCNAQLLRTLQIEEKHTMLAAQSAGENVLSRLFLPSTMQTIAGLGSFNSLRSLVCLSAVPPVLEDTTWCMTYDSATLYVPVNMYNRYRLHPVWGRFRKICPIGYQLAEVTDTVGYHNTIQYAISDSLGAVVLRLEQPMDGKGIILPDSVAYSDKMFPVVGVADSAFSDVAGIQYIEAPHRALRCGNGCFRGWSSSTVLIVPEDSCIASYRADPVWGVFSHIISRRQVGDTISAEYYYSGGKPYQLFYRVLPDRRSLCLVRPTGGYANMPNKAAELSDTVMDKKLVPYCLTEIGDSVLAGCTQLERLSLNGSTRRIGNGFLAGCTGLTTVSVDSTNSVYYSPDATNGIVRRSDHVLLWGSLSSQLSDSVLAIGDEAFAGLPLAQMTIPASVDTIGAHAFRDCPLEYMRLLDEEPAGLADNALEGVDSEVVIFVPRTACNIYRAHPVWGRFPNITPWYEAGDTIAQQHVAGAYTSGYTLHYRVLDEASVELMAPSYRVEDGLAAGVVDLTDTLAFRFVVTQLADGALRGCKDVYTVHLGHSVSYLGDSVFYGCSQLNRIICDALIPPAAVRATFDGMDLGARVDVPASVRDIYKEADGWRYFFCFNPIFGDSDVDPENKPGSEMGLEDLLSSDEAVKVVMDGHVWIIRDGVLYDLLGRRR